MYKHNPKSGQGAFGIEALTRIESDNHLAAELVGQDQYQHITTLSELAPPTAEVIRKLVNWTPVKSKKNAADSKYRLCKVSRDDRVH